MLLAVCGSAPPGPSAGFGTANGLPSVFGLTGSVTKSVRVVRLLRLLPVGIDAPLGWEPVVSSVGRLVSIRKLSAEAVAKPGTTCWSGGATATNVTLFSSFPGRVPSGP